MNNDEKNILSQLNKVPVQVPNDDFFESLKVHVVDKINTETKIVPFYKRMSFKAAATIAVLIAIGSVYFLQNNTKPEVQPTQTAKADFSTLSKQDILAYIEENSEEFETEDLVGVLAEIPSIDKTTKKNNSEIATTNSTTVKSNATQKLWKELDDEDIMKYLEEQGEDLDEELILGT